MEHDGVSILRSEDQNDIEMAAIASEEKVILPIEAQLTSVCIFPEQENFTVESEERSKSATKLSGLIIFYLIVMAVEVVGGVKANSLAVITDAAHLLTDVAGFSISLFTVWVSGWKATSHQSFGYSRLEVLGALLSVQLIWLISGVLIYEAIDRILHKNARVNGELMFAIVLFGFIINLSWSCGWVMITLTTHAMITIMIILTTTRARTNVQHMKGRRLSWYQSVGVMIAGAIIWAKPDWLVVDLLCTLLFSTFVLFTTLPMLRDIFCILMERTPYEIDVGRLESALKCIKGVQDVHNLHVWSITAGKLVLSCHVMAEPGASSPEILRKIGEYCEKMHRIHNITIQIE
ncbi:metal tolerance protein B-like [Populus alba x Populus x berolinensis]|uniref:Metal tolerance protein B-like n=1 Tax=Populus alba x Populus x berolinensis TaxID=444605 RepID=A0AAD6RPK4_9ROSI|nr:metal tolerance protein B-like [Populus alba x Populus x berolinensis]